MDLENLKTIEMTTVDKSLAYPDSCWNCRWHHYDMTFGECGGDGEVDDCWCDQIMFIEHADGYADGIIEFDEHFEHYCSMERICENYERQI